MYGSKKNRCIYCAVQERKNLTQIQLAERLEITNQAVSKWENGRGMPDVSLLQPLCDVLGISLNELFSGEHISAEEYKGKAEENISNLFKEKQIANLKPVKYLFSICANVALLVAVIESAVGFVGNIFHSTIWKPMLINVSVWLLLFLVSTGKLVYDQKIAKPEAFRHMYGLRNRGHHSCSLDQSSELHQLQKISMQMFISTKLILPNIV